MADPEITDRQKQMLIDIYESFRKEVRAEAAAGAAAAGRGGGPVRPARCARLRTQGKLVSEAEEAAEAVEDAVTRIPTTIRWWRPSRRPRPSPGPTRPHRREQVGWHRARYIRARAGRQGTAALGFNALGPLIWLNWALLVAAFIIEVWAFVGRGQAPERALPAAGKQTKPLWLIITGVSLAVGLFSAADTSPCCCSCRSSRSSRPRST